MHKLLLIYLVLLFSPAIFASEMSVDSLLRVLDETIKERENYVEEKEKSLSHLKREFYNHPDLLQRFDIAREIFFLYKPYQIDSALIYANKRIEIAGLLENPVLQQSAYLNLAEALMISGMYKEAFDILETKMDVPVNEEQQAYIYHLYHSLYVVMADYTLSLREREEYLTLQYQYKDSILSVLSPYEQGYFLTKSSKLAGEGKYGEALECAWETFRSYRDEEHHIALSAHTLSEVYKAIGDEENRKRFLIISAIGDLRAGVKEYISLQHVANILYKEGDINRAYDYIKCSMEDAIFCNARYRTLEISQMLPIINDTYDMKMKSEKRKLIIFLFIISILSVVLILAIAYIFRQLSALVKARHSLREMNNDLKKVNEELHQLNDELSESNIVKEEYIGYVFNLCSAYIDKLEEFRKKVNRKLKAGQSKELLTLTGSSTLVSSELKELYRNFDLIFLNLYPDFIEGFNSLLQDEEHILPKEGELLSPELRIYALVRLGINDSVKIAGFLHYSPQTVYNYRLKVRNKAKVEKDNFPEAVRQIGQLRK